MTEQIIRLEGLASLHEELRALSEKVDRLTALMDDGELWEVSDVARYCKVSQDTVRRWAREGSIEVHSRRGRKMLFDPASVKEIR